MREIYTDKNGYKRWKDNNELVRVDVSRNKIGGALKSPEIVHRNDGNKSNFRKGNSSITSRSFHSSLDVRKRRNKKW